MSNELILPKFLDLPEKLLPIITEFNKYRYFLIDGGRGGAKTQSIGRLLLYLAEQKTLRIVCGRETQNSIEESVYTVLKDLIIENKLNFDVLGTRIQHRETETNIRFRGFREQGAANIKGLEGISILWVDEAQSISKNTLDTIIPTIRKEKSKVFWTMNRHEENDPVYIEFANRPDCLHIKINYYDNQHCPEVLKQEAEHCKRKSETDYNHIWLGMPLSIGQDKLFSMDMIQESIQLDLERAGTRKRVLANDCARFGDCENVFTILESRGPIYWEQIHQDAFKGLDGSETVGKHYKYKKDFNLDLNIIDSDGMGSTISDMIEGINLIRFSSVAGYEKKIYENRRTEAYFKLAEWMKNKWIKILNDPILIEQLLTIRYKYSTHDVKRLYTKDEMRLKNINSPDRADALAMAVYYAGSTLDHQPETQYYPTHDINQPQYYSIN